MGQAVALFEVISPDPGRAQKLSRVRATPDRSSLPKPRNEAGERDLIPEPRTGPAQPRGSAFPGRLCGAASGTIPERSAT
jgi:hypothetical protein